MWCSPSRPGVVAGVPGGPPPRAATLVASAKRMTGKVVSTVNTKTAVVSVERWWVHPIYKKRLRRSKKYQVHDEDELAKVGDMVQIASCRPVSATKHFALDKVLDPVKQ